MPSIYLYPLFVLLVALRLDSNEAAFPPHGFQDFCLVAIEAIGNAGLWRYDPNEKVIKGIPTMYKMKRHMFPNSDKRKVYEDKHIVKNASLTWSKTWWWFSRYGLRFSQEKSRLDYEEPHPCSFHRRGPHLYRVMRDFFGARQVGWAQVINEIVNVECVPQHGALSSQLPYDLPQYDGMNSVYSCATWLKEIEASSGVPSKATAVEVDFRAETCTLYYEDHKALSATNRGHKEYCFLKKAFHIPRFPGFYEDCIIYVEHPVFAGLWELEFLHRIPYLGRRKATMDTPSSVEVHLGDGFDGARAMLRDGQLQFFNDKKFIMKIPMQWHICIGPDTGQIQRIDVSKSELGSIYRYDNGLDCVPFSGFGKLHYKFSGYQKYNLLADNYSIRSCKEYIKQVLPFGQWKVVISTVEDGPCWAFGGGLDYSQMSLVPRLNTYSCFSTKYYKTIRPVSSCKYFVEAGELSGNYVVDMNWDFDYSQFPTLIREDSDASLAWEDGYKLINRNQVFTVDLGGVNICPEKEDPTHVPVRYNKKQIGFMYRYDDNSLCDPWPIAVEPKNRDNGGFDEFSADSLKDCITQYKEKHGEETVWRAVARDTGTCLVFHENQTKDDLILSESYSNWESTTNHLHNEYACLNKLESQEPQEPQEPEEPQQPDVSLEYEVLLDFDGPLELDLQMELGVAQNVEIV